jgi:Zn-dependent peptidase ImmA (M78 family)
MPAELSCALADEIWAQSEFGVISKAKTDRQKFQRAFAQNLLVPFSSLKKMIEPANPTELQIRKAAKHYHVHENVITRLLILEKVLPEETLGQRLEAA